MNVAHRRSEIHMPHLLLHGEKPDAAVHQVRSQKVPPRPLDALHGPLGECHLLCALAQELSRKGLKCHTNDISCHT
jgi:hypothetical protein